MSATYFFRSLLGRGIALYVPIDCRLPPASGSQVSERLRILQSVFPAGPRIVAEDNILDVGAIGRVVAAAEDRQSLLLRPKLSSQAHAGFPRRSLRHVGEIDLYLLIDHGSDIDDP